jgi:Fe-Mn family superoxide dismutase
MPFELPALPYALDALEPWIDARTVEIHYTKHHQTYLNNLNKALEAAPNLFEQPLEDLLKDLSQVPEAIRTAVRNNGGGVYNHNLYWQMLGPNAGGQPVGELAKAILASFDSFEAFKAEMEKAGLTRFGSGYAWLSRRPDGSLLIHSTANQDCPLSDGLLPLFTIDVWEHAYYLKYQNRRAEYLTNFWNLINWEKVEARYQVA